MSFRSEVKAGKLSMYLIPLQRNQSLPEQYVGLLGDHERKKYSLRWRKYKRNAV